MRQGIFRTAFGALVVGGFLIPEAVASAQACCSITSIDQKRGVVSAKENATGRAFQFQVGDGKLLGSLRLGQAAYANFKTNQVSLDGRTACCSLLSGSTGSSARLPESGGQQPGARPTAASKGGQQPQPTPDIRPTEGTTGGAIRGLTAAKNPGSGSSGGEASVPGGVVVPGNVTPPVLPYPDIEGEQEPLQYVVKNRSSLVTARFQNVGAEIPVDFSALDPRPTWYVDGQIRQPDDASTFGVHHGRPAWPTLAERSYTAKFTLPQGSHQVRAVMQVMPGERNPANNAATIPVTSGEAELSAQYDEKFVDHGDSGSYWRFRFWTQNTGDIPATCGMRLDFYDRSGFQDPNVEEPWSLKATVTDNIKVAAGGKSEYFFVQLRYNGTFSDPTQLPQPPHQYRFVLKVDEANVVVEENKANNTLEDKTLRAGANSLKWGKNPW